MDWKTDNLGNLEIEFIDGDRSSRYPKRSDFVSDGVPFLNAESIKNGFVSLENANFITEDKFLGISKGRLEDGDLILTTRGNGVGNAAFFCGIPRALINAQLLILRPNPERLSPKFLYYAFVNPQFQAVFRGFVSGSAQPQIPIRSIKNIPFSYPLLDAQERIAEILAAYDDLIQTNDRRIALLEESVHLLYREWFVNLRFPGCDENGGATSERIPDGWEEVTIAELASVNQRSITKRAAPENVQYVDIASVSTGSINEIQALRFTDAPSRARRIVQHGDIIWSMVRPGRRSYALVLNPPENLIASTGFAVLTPEKVPSSFLYSALAMDSFVGHLENVATGAAYPAVKPKDFEAFPLLIPTKELLRDFDEYAQSAHMQIHTLKMQNQRLREARDGLLPRLMNGSIAV